MAGNILKLTDDTFDAEVTNSETPVLVDFWAAWCGPCRAIAPVVEEISEDYATRLKVAKLNVDENPRTPGRFGIRAIPTLIIFKGGQPVETIVGAVSKAQIEEAINKVL